MRMLYFDIDTLRADHLGCYGYHRDTSPNIDRIASEGTIFTNYYASDAPCLPSRAALFLGRPGIHTGVVDHGGVAADPYITGPDRWFRERDRPSWPMAVRNSGYYPVSFSPYAERHSAWWFHHGWREFYNPGKCGMERADEVVPQAIEWIGRHGADDNWFLHINVWDPHTPYRTPEEFGYPFQNAPPPDWINDDIIREHFSSYGPHSAQDSVGFGPGPERSRMPSQIKDMGDYVRWINGYDVGILYADHYFGLVLKALEEQGVLDETAIIISADHGENQGELNIYGDHHTADNITCRVPFVVRWPGKPAGQVNEDLHYNYDLPPTTMELIGGEPSPHWEGRSFAAALDGKDQTGRPFLVVGNCAWSCQRSVRFEDWLLMRTYHSGMKAFEPLMLFDIKQDPHLTDDLAGRRSQVVNEGLGLLERWTADMMATSDSTVDPLWTVMDAGGPFHTRNEMASYCQRLRQTGRAHHAHTLERLGGGYLVGE
jgi:arylsulfatase A-like enzyme